MRALILVILVALAGCATGPNRYEMEFQAYVNYLDSEIRAGRMTREQGLYVATNKLNQLRSQQAADNNARDQAVVNALGAAAAINRANQPYTLTPPPRQPIICDTTYRGKSSSTSCGRRYGRHRTRRSPVDAR